MTQQSISWNRRHMTQIPDCHQPSARKKSKSENVREQRGRMRTAEGKESQSLTGSEQESERAQKKEGDGDTHHTGCFQSMEHNAKAQQQSVT